MKFLEEIKAAGSCPDGEIPLRLLQDFLGWALEPASVGNA